MLSRRNAEFEVIAQVAALVNEPPDLPSNLDTALSLASRVLETDFLAVFQYNDSDKFVFTSAYSRDPKSELFRQHCKEMIDLPLLELAVKQRDWVRTLDISQSQVPLTAQQLNAYEQLGVNRVGVKPIITQDRILGAMLLMRHRFHNIPITEITFAETFTNHLALLIINHQLKTQVRDLAIMEERRRMASELHDSVTQSLFSLGMANQSLVNILGDLPGPAGNALKLIDAQTRNIQVELRKLINELRPLNLRDKESLDYALKLHISSLQQTMRAATHLQIEGDPRRMPLAVQQTLNRIAQEALSNIARHSQASKVDVCLTIEADEVRLQISDNGVGFSPSDQRSSQFISYGLTSMRDRAEFIGGSLELKTFPGTGVEILVRVPLDAKLEAEHE
jgi:signal transduction histidine kinase